MYAEQAQLTAHGWSQTLGGLAGDASLVLLFGSTEMLSRRAALDEISAAYPNALTFGCSTAGEIAGTDVCDDSLVVTAMRFDHTDVRGARVCIDDARESCRVGRDLASALDPEGLVHVLVLSDGLNVNGSELVKGLESVLPESVTVTGGLAGDGGRFQETLVVWDGVAASKTVAVVGLYGDRLQVGCGSMGGWDPFGPERVVTRSDGNVLYELDGHSALDLYKTYLGEHAAGLPATGLFFPLSMRRDGDERLVRTILSVDEAAQSLIFAGDVPEGAQVRLMTANFDRLVDGAMAAASTCREAVHDSAPDLALLISCVGRKMVLQQRVEEEVEGVGEVLGGRPALTGFYSYGEISPFTPGARCELHNQTMTITTLREA